MTRIDYELLARSLKATTHPEFLTEIGRAWEVGYGSACAAVADACEGQNTRFDRERFLSACGL